MKKCILLSIFIIMNSLAAFMAFQLWNTSSMGAHAGILALLFTGTIGTFLGAFLASKKFYNNSKKQWVFTLITTAVFPLLYLWTSRIVHPAEANGPFPKNPWHEFGFVWLYIIISSLWLFVHATRDEKV